jgi:enoyl-CoA hydratase/carnithine racemase
MTSTVVVERRGHVLTIGIDRPEKANAFDAEVIGGLALAYGRLAEDPELRVGLVHSRAAHFTAGLDLASIAPAIAAGGEGLLPEGGRDPWRLFGEATTKPIVVAVHGRCYTAGLELVLAADICVAADDTLFGQMEVGRGIVAFGGATLRLPRRVGWGNAMRYLLTGDTFDAAEALRIGLVQHVVPRGEELDHALALADRIAAQAPLAVQATLAEARAADAAAATEARDRLRPLITHLLATADAHEGIAALIERRAPTFTGT